MKKVLIIACSFIISMSYAQSDTTSNRLITINDGGTINIFNDNYNYYYDAYIGTLQSGHAIFVNPDDNYLYTIAGTTSADRNLYKINPFSKGLTLIYDFTEEYIHSADLGDNNIVYGVTGNANATPGKVVKLDLNTMTESILYVSASGTSGNPRAMEFNSTDSSLYIYEGFSSKLYIYDLATGTETMHTTTGLSSELHGAYYLEDSDNFLLIDYSDDINETDGTYLNATIIHSDVEGMDLTEFKMLNTYGNEISICESDSTEIALVYTDSIDWVWYKDGNLLPNTTSSIWVNQTGGYQALIHRLDDGDNYYFWSETIEVIYYAQPQVNLSQVDNDSLICSGESIIITGANGGSLQWYKNGVLIPGETSNTLTVTTAGSYTQTKVNMSGCIGISTTPFVIYDCTLNIYKTDKLMGVSVYPNPLTDKIRINLNDIDFVNIELNDLQGKLIIPSKKMNSGSVLDLSKLETGIYFITITSSDNKIVKKIIKE